jgi:hypothetical protein
MKKTTLILATAAAASLSFGEGAVKQFNELGYGTVSGRLQTLSMYRDYDNGDNNHSTTLGLKLDYLSPEKAGWTAGASYIGAGVLDSMYNEPDPGSRRVNNGMVNVLNEAYLNYNMAALGLTNTTATIGRRVNNGEVFRADEFRQKPRAIEAFMVESRELHKTKIVAGHTIRMSNWIQSGDLAEFNDFDDVFALSGDPVTGNAEGITWAEVVNNCVEDLEVAVFDAVAYDVANLLGARAKFSLSDDTAILGYFRNETDTGSATSHDATAVGLSIQQKVCSVTLEGGYFGVQGDTLRFQELTTGINHALGASMMIYSEQFNGGSDTLYLKAVTTLEKTKTLLYGLGNITWQDDTPFNGAELNIVVKQPITDDFSLCFKGGLGYRDGKNAATGDTTATDGRLFVTYTF